MMTTKMARAIASAIRGVESETERRGRGGITRSLYDQAYLDSGCPEELFFDESTDVDNYPWTYWTDFAIAAVCFWGFVKLVFFRERRSSVDGSPAKVWLPVPLYFLFLGIGAVLGGVQHAVVATVNDAEKLPLEYVGHIFLTSAQVFLAVAGLAMLGVTCGSDSVAEKALWWIAVVGLSALSICATYFMYRSYLIFGAMMIGVSLLQATVYFATACRGGKADGDGVRGRRKRRLANAAKGAGLVTFVAGIALMEVFRGKCWGLENYENCFEDCPFPRGFNQNALFHVVAFVAVIVMTAAEVVSPSVEVAIDGKGGKRCRGGCGGGDETLDEAEKAVSSAADGGGDGEEGGGGSSAAGKNDKDRRNRVAIGVVAVSYLVVAAVLLPAFVADNRIGYDTKDEGVEVGTRLRY